MAALFMAGQAYAFDPFIVRDIRVEGLQRTEAGSVFSYLPIRVGDRVTDANAAEAVKALFATGFFKDVRLSADGDVLIVTVEEIVDKVTPEDTSGQFISSINITAVVHAPMGAYPTGVPGRYQRDDAHIRRYVDASISDEAFAAYLDEFVHGMTEDEIRNRMALPSAK